MLSSMTCGPSKPGCMGQGEEERRFAQVGGCAGQGQESGGHHCRTACPQESLADARACLLGGRPVRLLAPSDKWQRAAAGRQRGPHLVCTHKEEQVQSGICRGQAVTDTAAAATTTQCPPDADRMRGTWAAVEPTAPCTASRSAKRAAWNRWIRATSSTSPAGQAATKASSARHRSGVCAPSADSAQATMHASCGGGGGAPSVFLLLPGTAARAKQCCVCGTAFSTPASAWKQPRHATQQLQGRACGVKALGSEAGSRRMAATRPCSVASSEGRGWYPRRAAPQRTTAWEARKGGHASVFQAAQAPAEVCRGKQREAVDSQVAQAPAWA